MILFRIIEINGQSVVAVPHERIVNLLATSVGEVQNLSSRVREGGGGRLVFRVLRHNLRDLDKSGTKYLDKSKCNTQKAKKNCSDDPGIFSQTQISVPNFVESPTRLDQGRIIDTFVLLLQMVGWQRCRVDMLGRYWYRTFIYLLIGMWVTEFVTYLQLEYWILDYIQIVF